MKKAAVLVVLMGTLSAVSAFVIERLDLEKGRNEENRINTPMFDTSGIGTVRFGAIESSYDTGDYLVYLMHKSLLTPKPKRPKPHYKLDPSVDLGDVFGDVLGSESVAMGFREGAGGWTVTGSIRDIVLEIRPSGGGFGPLLFFGYMDLELDVEGAGTHRMKLYNFSQNYNAGFGAQDEAKETLARFLIESAQEALARLNRDVFHAPPLPDIAARLEKLVPNEEHQEHDLLLIGLSGSTEAVPKLLGLLEAEKDESDRVNILNALANIGSPDAFDALARRYAGEDEDCRLYTLKAMGYMETEQARAFIAENGSNDKYLPIRVWASRAVDSP
jgi:hypothetical protein